LTIISEISFIILLESVLSLLNTLTLKLDPIPYNISKTFTFGSNNLILSLHMPLSV
jgi:hypothetical protein